MKLTIPARDLAAATGLAAQTIDPKNTIPALRAFHLEAAGGSLRIGANNLDDAIAVTVEAKVEADGECAPPAAPLAKLAGALEGEVGLAANERGLSIQCGRARYTLPVIPATDMPGMPQINAEAGIELDLEQALRAFSRPLFAASRERTAYYLNGLLLQDAGNGRIRSVATDGHRLASVSSTAVPLPASDFDPEDVNEAGRRGIIVPRESVALILKLFRTRKPASVELRRSKSLLQVTAADGFTLTSKLIDGTFPDYERLIPGWQQDTATLDRAELIAALGRLAAVANRESKQWLGVVGLAWAEGDTAIRLSLSRQPDAATDLIDAELTGSAQIAFSIPLLTEQIEELQREHVRFDVNGNGAAMITDPGDDGLVTLLMPCRW